MDQQTQVIISRDKLVLMLNKLDQILQTIEQPEEIIPQNNLILNSN